MNDKLTYLTLVVPCPVGSQSFFEVNESSRNNLKSLDTDLLGSIWMPNFTAIRITEKVMLAEKIRETILAAEEMAFVYVQKANKMEVVEVPVVLSKAMQALEDAMQDEHSQDRYRHLSMQQRAYMVAYVAQEIQNEI